MTAHTPGRQAARTAVPSTPPDDFAAEEFTEAADIPQALAEEAAQ